MFIFFNMDNAFITEHLVFITLHGSMSVQFDFLFLPAFVVYYALCLGKTHFQLSSMVAYPYSLKLS